MHAPKSSPLTSELPNIAADILARVRARKPRVHCITNAVAQAFTANVLLAAGAVPSMTVAPEEIGEFVARADALLVNLGTLDRERRAAALVAACLAVEADAWHAASAGLLAFAVAGECAATRAHGPGSFAVEIVDALHGLDRETLRARARVVR